MADGKLRYIKPTKGYSIVTCGWREGCGVRQAFHARGVSGEVTNCTAHMAARAAIESGWARYKHGWVCPDHAVLLASSGALTWKVIGNQASGVLRVVMGQDVVPPPYVVVQSKLSSYQQAAEIILSLEATTPDNFRERATPVRNG